MFGLGADASQTLTVVPPVTLKLGPGRIVFVTGASGGGKSTLLRGIAAGLAGDERAEVLDFGALPEPSDAAVVDAVDGGALPLDRALRVLSLAGLNDAFVMLRRPSELSDGQRYRFRLAQTMAAVEIRDRERAGGDGKLTAVLADEFGATLDRTTAVALSRNVRRWVDASLGTEGPSQGPTSGGVCLVVATTHDDLLEALSPDVLVEQRLGEGIEIVEAGS